jgi:5-methylcytosine-specific restriction enzyme A
MPTINLNRKKRIYERKYIYTDEIQQIYNSKMWKRLRLWYLQQHPLCEECLKKDKITPAKEVHHKKKISTGVDIDEKLSIALDENNLESVCIKCHHILDP